MLSAEGGDRRAIAYLQHETLLSKSLGDELLCDDGGYATEIYQETILSAAIQHIKALSVGGGH